jgi:hypothetical protein
VKKHEEGYMNNKIVSQKGGKVKLDYRNNYKDTKIFSTGILRDCLPAVRQGRDSSLSFLIYLSVDRFFIS